ncbi:hypothetical protein EGW08_004330, partial [Elysia chlorotica]
MAYGGTSGLQRVSNQTVEQLQNLTFPGWDTSEKGRQTLVYGMAVGTASLPQIRRVVLTGAENWKLFDTFSDLENLAHNLDNSNENIRTIGKEGKNADWKHDTDQSSVACSMTCSEHAQCLCSLTTGQTLCTCLPGYFGNGQHCTPCPKGSYKEDTSARRRCDSCPIHLGTRDEGATSAHLCKPGL